MPFRCKVCDKYYDTDCGKGFKCENCGALGSLVRCEPEDNNGTDD